MRLLVIGFPLPDPAIDNYTVFSAPSYSDYDALFVDPTSITTSVRQLVQDGTEFNAHDDRPVLNAPTTANSVSGADQVRRRADETRRLLEAGGTVLVTARPDAVQAGLLGFEGCDRYSWLPAPAAIAWGPPFIRPAEGKTVRIVAEDHPLASVLRDFRGETSYRAVFDDRQAELRRQARFIATGGSGIPIAAEFQVLGGRVIFIPALDEGMHRRPELASALVQMCVRLDSHSEPAPPPYWSKSLALPGLEQVEAELEESETAAAAATAHVAAVQERHEAMARHRRLLFEDGPIFVSAVAEALRFLGFSVRGGAGDPLAVTSEGTHAFVETESSRDQVVEWPYVRLQRRLEDHLLSTSEQLKGIVIVNGKRDSAPDQRSEQYTEPLRVACENYRYSLITSETLFTLMQRVLGGADEATLLGIRRKLMNASGLLTPESLLSEPEAKSANETIF